MLPQIFLVGEGRRPLIFPAAGPHRAHLQHLHSQPRAANHVGRALALAFCSNVCKFRQPAPSAQPLPLANSISERGVSPPPSAPLSPCAGNERFVPVKNGRLPRYEPPFSRWAELAELADPMERRLEADFEALWDVDSFERGLAALPSRAVRVLRRRDFSNLAAAHLSLPGVEVVVPGCSRGTFSNQSVNGTCRCVRSALSVGARKCAHCAACGWN